MNRQLESFTMFGIHCLHPQPMLETKIEETLDKMGLASGGQCAVVHIDCHQPPIDEVEAAAMAKSKAAHAMNCVSGIKTGRPAFGWS